jgi:Protein of unknown function (DUF3106)
MRGGSSFPLRLLAALSLALLVGCCLAPAAAAERLAWARLTPAQQQALTPLAADWPALEPERQAKWLEVAGRFPTMSAAERQRLHSRMAEWARLTPAQRRTARLQFQETRSVSPEDRQAAWKAYQALPEDQRQRLVQQSGPAARGVATPKASTSTPKAKVNVVQSSTPARARAVTATTRQARHGATTSPMTQNPLPPAAIQHGLPKIAATPGFVDPATLLPRRGPQGAAVAQAAASAPAAAP